MNNIKNIGVNDHAVDLFEGQYKVPNGMAYNSYLIEDEKCALLDTVDAHFGAEWQAKVEAALAGRACDYLVIHHMEPDHSANIARFLSAHSETTVVTSAQAFKFMEQFFGSTVAPKRQVVKEGDILHLGVHSLQFITAPMVHWPEVLVSYEASTKTLFSADAFGKFGALDVDEPWDDEARRYYIGIVGKFGVQAQALLKKASALDIQRICPLHGPILQNTALTNALAKYTAWASYASEEDGVTVAYTSVYGNTRAVALAVADELRAKGKSVAVFDLARDDMSSAIASSFRYSTLVLATTTYNGSIFPIMHTFIEGLVERNFQQRRVAFIENGTWAPLAAKVMKDLLAPCKNLTLVEPVITVRSSELDGGKAKAQTLAAAL